MFLGLVLAAGARAAELDVGVPQLAAVSVVAPPVIDGSLNDDCWAGATRVGEFNFPPERRPESEPTEAWICLDRHELYVAFYCHDSQPDTILSQQTTRGGSLIRDDYIAFHVDPSLRQINHYTFRVSANGTQDDSIPDAGSGNIAWRGDWRAAAVRVADGYTVELAVPFSMLRYQKGQDTFAVAFGRNLERLEEGDIWPPMEDRFERRYMALLGPLDLPDPVNRPLVLPYAIGRVDDGGATLQSGLDVRHTFQNGVVGMFTANPDFRNIEDVVDTIAFSDVPRLLGETRPFFNEAAGLFPGSTSLNTRNIPGITSGVKTFARLGRHEYGIFGVLSDRGRWDSAFDYTYFPNPNTQFGTGYVWHDGGDLATNLVTSSHFSTFHPLGAASLTWSGSLHQSQTAGPLGEGLAWGTSVSYGGNGVLGWNASYSFIDPTFKAVIGYVPEPDLRGWKIGLSGSKRTQEQFIQSHSWYVNALQRGKSDGSLLQTYDNAGGSLRFANGTSCGIGLYTSQRPPNRDRTISANYAWGLETLYEEGHLNFTIGQRGGGDYLYAEVQQGWSPVAWLRFHLKSEYIRRDFFDPTLPREILTQNLLTATAELDPYSSVSARFIERDGDLNLFLAYRHAPASGRTLHLFFGDPNSQRTEVRFQCKVSWPL